MTDPKQLNDLVQQAAFRIVQVLNVFEDQPPHIRQQAEQFVMRRVMHMKNGMHPQDPASTIDGDQFIVVVEEPENTPVPPVDEPVEEPPVEDPPEDPETPSP